MIFKQFLLIFTKVWILYVMMFVVLCVSFNRTQVADDVLNTARPSADYLHFFSYGTKPFDKKEFKRAKAYYQTLIASAIATPAMYANLGYCYYYLNNVKKALEFYEIAKFKDQRMYIFYFDVGIIQFELKDYLSAADNFKKALILLPKTSEALIKAMHIGPKHAKNEMYGYYFQQRVPFDNLLANIYLLKSLIKLNLYEEVLGYAAEAMKEFPNDPEIYYYAAEASFQLGFLKNALALIYKSLDVAPNYSQGYVLRSSIMKALGNDKEFMNDMALSKQFSSNQGWQRKSNITLLHHWDENTLLFQIYH